MQLAISSRLRCITSRLKRNGNTALLQLRLCIMFKLNRDSILRMRRFLSGGGGGIRTHEALRPGAFQVRWNEPLSDPSLSNCCSIQRPFAPADDTIWVRMPNQNAVLHWSAYEHEHVERGSDWYLALGIV